MRRIASYEFIANLIKGCATEHRIIGEQGVSIYPIVPDPTGQNGGAGRAAAAYQARSLASRHWHCSQILYLSPCMML
jgi:hypothetical protein